MTSNSDCFCKFTIGFIMNLQVNEDSSAQQNSSLMNRLLLSGSSG